MLFIGAFMCKHKKNSYYVYLIYDVEFGFYIIDPAVIFTRILEWNLNSTPKSR